MASFRETFITFSLLGLMIFSLMSFVFFLQEDAGLTETIKDDPLLNKSFSNLGNELETELSSTNASKTAYEGEVPTPGFGSLIIFAIVGVAQTFSGLVVGIYNILVILPANYLGVPQILFQVLGSILTVSIVLLSWRVYRAGD